MIPDWNMIDWTSIDWRGVACTVMVLAIAWLAWTFSPSLIAWVGLNDLELLGRFCAVIGALSVVEALFARLVTGSANDH